VAPACHNTLPSPKCKGPFGNSQKRGAPSRSAGLHFTTGSPQVLGYIVFTESQSCRHLGKRISLNLLQDEHIPARGWQHERSQQGQLEGCFVRRGDGMTTSQMLGPNLMSGNLHVALPGPIPSCSTIGFRFATARRFDRDVLLLWPSASGDRMHRPFVVSPADLAPARDSATFGVN